MTSEEKWMERCLQLARCGMLGVAPNPMVGAVIVHNNRIIGEGYHRQYGKAHAEVNAIASVKNKELLRQSTLYVSLEPCAHFGKTPPCAKLIVETGIPRVVIGCEDPFAKVHGEGIRILREAGVEITVGVLEEACRKLNRQFITRQTLHRPFITLKWAQSADGYIAPPNGTGQATPISVSSPHTQIRVHHLRACHQAILVGRVTAETDNPSLTVRHWAGNQPLRIAFDRHAQLKGELNLFDGKAPTLIVGEHDDTQRKANHTYDFMEADYKLNPITQLMEYLDSHNVQSLLVEGGKKVLESFIHQELWDQAHVEIGNNTFGGGVAAPSLQGERIIKEERFFGHIIRHYVPNKKSAYGETLRS